MTFIRHDCRLWICARFYHAFLRRCFDNTVLLKQSAYRTSRLFSDIVTYRRIRQWYPDVSYFPIHVHITLLQTYMVHALTT